MGLPMAECARGLVRALVGREVLAAASDALGSAAIPIVPLKGVYLHACVYAAPEDRPITDVDVLVPEARFDEARRILVARGWQWTPVNAATAIARSRAHALPLDVHQRLFLPGEFDLSTNAVFARATRDRVRLGFDVWWPDPMDAFAHLVGHFAKSRLGAADTMYFDDLEQLARTQSLDAVRCAERLQDVGMGRAARYALVHAARHAPDGFSAALLRALAPDVPGDLVAWLARGVSARFPKGTQMGALTGLALEPSLPRAGLALLRRVRARTALR